MTAEPLYIPLPCPSCGNPQVMAATLCMVHVGPGFAGFVYGRPDVLALTNDAFAKCASCDWEGTAGDVRR